MNKKNYFQKMIENGRCAVIEDNHSVVAQVFFSICDNPEKYLNNLNYEYMEHNPNGRIVVIEGMVCSDFKRKYLMILHDSFIKRFPQLNSGMWRRRGFPNDKIVTFKRRNIYATKH